MHREIIVTEDGSHTIRAGDRNHTYHSRHGALQESSHVYIHSGLQYLLDQGLNSVIIFEMGFGTGLNALLTLVKATERNIPVLYITVETEPLSGIEARALNYCSLLERPDLQPLFNELHDATWETNAVINPFFTIRKMRVPMEELELDQPVDLVYYDAFSPAAQPELWTPAVFERISGFMKTGAVLLTYCSKGDVKRAMKAAGLKVKKVPGPLYKRDILRVTKIG